MSISSHIRKRLTERGLSVHALEKQAGLKPSAVHNILYGRSKNPTAHTLQAIAQALDCSVADLINEENKEDSVFSSLTEPRTDTSKCESISKQLNLADDWSMDLYLECLEAATHLIKKFHISLPKNKFLDYVEEIYLYSKGRGKKVDKYFAEWLIKQEKS